MNNKTFQLYLDQNDHWLGYVDSNGDIQHVRTDVQIDIDHIRITDGGFLQILNKGTWEDIKNDEGSLVSLKGPKGDTGETGPQGPQGEQGLQGRPSVFKGTISTPTDMDNKIAEGAQIGDSYIISGVDDSIQLPIEEHNGSIFTVINDGWTYSGNIRGQKGADGKDGADGQNGVNGKDGANGLTPYVGENGNWFIGEEDTNVKAESTKIKFLSREDINDYITIYQDNLSPDNFGGYLKQVISGFNTNPADPDIAGVLNSLGTWAFNKKLNYPNSFILDKDLFTIELNGTNIVNIQSKQVMPSFEVRSGWLISSLNGVEEHLGNIQGPQGATGETGKDGHTPYLSVQEYKPGILALMADNQWITNELGEVFPVYCDTLAYPEHVSTSSWFNENKPHNTLVKWCGEDPLVLDSGETFDPGHVYRHVKAGNVAKALTLYGKGLDTEYPSEWVEFPVEEVNLLKLKWELLSIPYTYDPAKLIFSPMGSYVEVTMEDYTIDIQSSAPLFNEVFNENQDVNSFIDQNRTSGWMVGYKEFICQNDMWVLEEYNNEVPEAYKTLNLSYRMPKNSNEALENPTEL